MLSWLIVFVMQYVLVKGFEPLGIPVVNTDDLGGLYLTILLSVVGIVLSFPIGILLALGRRSDLPIIKVLCTILIEVVRGVPLITLLFMGRYILPFFIDGMQDIDLVIRMSIVLMFFSAAYLAEVIRGGLQVVPDGQVEAAKALGLNGLYVTTFIVLPQAIRLVIPAIMGQFVSLMKDTSLVAFIGLFEILGAARRILQGGAQSGFAVVERELYLYVGIIYFVFSYVLAAASRRLETTGSGATRRNRL
jgi:general L-amino acid transport system permease protein